jgi:hypothetical protein
LKIRYNICLVVRCGFNAKHKIEKKTIMKNQILDIAVGAVTIAVGYVIGSMIYNKMKAGSATSTSTMNSMSTTTTPTM